MPPQAEQDERDESVGGLADFWVSARVDLELGGRASGDEALAAIKKVMLDPSILDDEHQVVTWSAMMSSNVVDSYGTIMMPSTQKRYSDGADAGVPFQDSHQKSGQVYNLGQTFAGRYVGPGGNGKARSYADVYSVLGLAPEIDTWWGRARAGLMREVSVGFYPTEDTFIRCTICGLDMMRDWSCMHWPLQRYEVKDKDGKATGEMKTCYGQIENANLGELSTVYKGASPGAALVDLKALRGLELGEISTAFVERLEQTYRMALPRLQRSQSGIRNKSTQEGDEMPPEGNEETGRTAASPMTNEKYADLRLALVEAGRSRDEDPIEGIRALVDEIKPLRALKDQSETIKTLEARIAELGPLADDGKAYRTRKIEDAITEGKRAHGTEFKEETYRDLLTKAGMEAVERMAADWKAIADKNFEPGRATGDGDEERVTELGTRRRRSSLRAAQS